MNIYIPIWEFGAAGGMKVLTNLANFWQLKGHNVTMLCYEYSDEPYYKVDCKIKYLNKKGYAVDRKNKVEINGFYNKYINIYHHYSSLKNGINRYAGKLDIALANYSLTAYSVWFSKCKNKYYYIQAYEAWEDGQQNFQKRVLDKLVRFTYRLNMTRIVNANIYKNYKEIHSDIVIPPGIDLKVYYPKAEEWDGNREFVIGCIGRKEEWKGSNDVATAVSILQGDHYNIKFKVAFNKVDNPKYELVFPDGDKKLSDFYRSLDVLVAPGKIQLGAIHYPVIEAMACKTVVITTGYYPANNNNCYIVPVSCPEKIADDIKMIMKNYGEAKCKSDIALKEIGNFDWNIVAEKFLELFMKRNQD